MDNNVYESLISIFKSGKFSSIKRSDLERLEMSSIVNKNKEDVFDRENESPDIGGKASVVVKCENDEKNKIFISFCIFFYILNIIHRAETGERLMIGLDFEFNERKIALIQLAFFRPEKENTIFVVDPNRMKSDEIEIMIDTVFTSGARRIVHGSDSLDIPYIFEELFARDPDKILQFTKTVTDTRYLCEYYKIVNETGDKKCSIYDAMLFFKTIDEKIYDSLTNINKIMGPVQDVNWDMDRMDTYHLRYAAYDVYFLQYFLSNIIDMYGEHKESVDRGLSIELIPVITRMVYLEKYDVTKIVKISKEIVDPMNNYYIKTKKGNMTLIKIYNRFIESMFLDSVKLKITDILSINYFKSTLMYIFKRIVFYCINRKFTLFINKNTKYTVRMTLDDINTELDMIGSTRLKAMFNSFKDHVNNNIGIIFT